MNERLKFVTTKAAQLSAPIALTGAIAADIISQTKYRPDLPDFMEEHSGNLGFTGLFTLGLYALGTAMEAIGENTGKRRLQSIGQFLQPGSVAIMTGFTLGVEAQFIKNPATLQQNLPDTAFGMVSIALGWTVGSSIKNSLTTKKEHKKQQDFDNRLETARHLFEKKLEKEGLDSYVPTQNISRTLANLFNYHGADVIDTLEEEGLIQYP